MNPTSKIVEQAIAKQEAEEAGVIVDDKNPKGGENEESKKGAADDKKGKPGAGADGKPADDKGAAEPKYDKDGKRIEAPAEEEPELDADGKPVEKPEEEEGEFTADDALEVEEKPAAGQPAPTDPSGIQLSPQEQKYIADNIGEPIVIRGIRGDGDAAKEVEIKAYSPADIPTDFKFANDQQIMAAQTGFQGLEQKANSLLGNYRQQQSSTAAQDFEKRENEGIRADVADLQKDGRMAKFKVKPGAAGFDDDPAAVQMAEVLKIMSDRNETYLKQYNQGRPYKHIGFTEAYEIWERESPDRQASRKADDDQKAEDEARKKRGTERGESNRGTNPNMNIQRPTVKAGTTTRDILARIDSDDSY